MLKQYMWNNKQVIDVVYLISFTRLITDVTETSVTARISTAQATGTGYSIFLRGSKIL